MLIVFSAQICSAAEQASHVSQQQQQQQQRRRQQAPGVK
jgi:hypothetical protein